MKVIIEAEFGSKWQHKIQRDALMLVLKAWQRFMDQKHKKNKSEITIIDTD